MPRSPKKRAVLPRFLYKSVKPREPAVHKLRLISHVLNGVSRRSSPLIFSALPDG